MSATKSINHQPTTTNPRSHAMTSTTPPPPVPTARRVRRSATLEDARGAVPEPADHGARHHRRQRRAADA